MTFAHSLRPHRQYSKHRYPEADRSHLPKDEAEEWDPGLRTVALRGYSRQLASSWPSWQSWWPSQRFQLGIHFFGWWHSNSNRSHCPSWVGVEAAVEFARKMLFLSYFLVWRKLAWRATIRLFNVLGAGVGGPHLPAMDRESKGDTNAL